MLLAVTTGKLASMTVATARQPAPPAAAALQPLAAALPTAVQAAFIQPATTTAPKVHDADPVIAPAGLTPGTTQTPHALALTDGSPNKPAEPVTDTVKPDPAADNLPLPSNLSTGVELVEVTGAEREPLDSKPVVDATGGQTATSSAPTPAIAQG